MSDGESVLLTRYAEARDPDAFRALVESYQNFVFAACNRVLRNSADAEDAAQTCFLEMARNAGKLHAPIAPWLHCVAVRASLKLAQQNKSRREREGLAMKAKPEKQEPSWEEVRGYVDEAIATLPQELREALVLHYLDGRSQEAIATELGVTQSAVSKRLKRGVDELREHLGKAGWTRSVAALAMFLLTKAAEAAPATLTVALGKMALAGPSSGAVSAAASTTSAAGGKALAAKVALLKGVGLMKLAGISLLAAAAVTTGVIAVNKASSAPPVSPPSSTNVAPAAKEVFIAMQAGQDQLQSGKGNLTWAKHGEYFGTKLKDGSMRNVSFAFDADKLRYDMSDADGKIISKQAVNGLFWLNYHKTRSKNTLGIVETVPEEPPTLLSTRIISLKRLSQYYLFSTTQLMQMVQVGPWQATTATEPDGLIFVTLFTDHEKAGRVEFRLWVDPKKGFNIVKETQISLGKKVNEIQREFQKVNGVWALKDLTWNRYHVDSGEVEGTTRITVQNLELNSTIPENTFNFRGFDLPNDTLIRDKVANIEYTLNPELALVEQTEQLSEEAGWIRPQASAFESPLPSDSIPAPASNKNQQAAVTTPVKDKEQPPRRTPNWLWGAVFFISLLILAGVWWYCHRRTRCADRISK